jgi:hypothetical protein
MRIRSEAKKLNGLWGCGKNDTIRRMRGEGGEDGGEGRGVERARVCLREGDRLVIAYGLGGGMKVCVNSGQEGKRASQPQWSFSPGLFSCPMWPLPSARFLNEHLIYR